MLELKVRHGEKEVTLQFEHSLLSLSKWEARNRVPFLTDRQKLPSEIIDYFKDMLVDPEVDPDMIYLLSPEQQDQLGNYINEPQTASSIPEQPESKYNPEITTSELIYYWMVSLKINWEAQTWHLSRLMMLIQVTAYKNQPPKKRNPKEVMQDWRALNEERKKRFGTSG